jgi:hypothetical protein
MRRFLREQPCNRVGNFYRATDTANGMNGSHLIERPFAAKYLQQHFGSYCARTDGIDPDSIPALFDCGGTALDGGHRDRTPLRSRIPVSRDLRSGFQPNSVVV